jgi:hypothetical protein
MTQQAQDGMAQHRNAANRAILLGQAATGTDTGPGRHEERMHNHRASLSRPALAEQGESR